MSIFVLNTSNLEVSNTCSGMLSEYSEIIEKTEEFYCHFSVGVAASTYIS